MQYPQQQQYFMGMPKRQAYQQESIYGSGYGSYNSMNSYSSDLPYNTWWPQYIKALYILARTYDASTPETMIALKAFLNNLSKLMPNAQFRQIITDYISMKPYVIQTIQQTNPAIFRQLPWLYDTLHNDVKGFHEMAIKNQDSQAFFLWVYLLDIFVLGLTNQTRNIPSLQEMRGYYQPDKISIGDWGNAFWHLLHTCSLYAPEPIDQSFMCYKDMVKALRFLLPCPKCRTHLTQNLQYVDFDTCPRTREELFKCSWKLHNIVNKSNNKPMISLQDAFSMYTTA